MKKQTKSQVMMVVVIALIAVVAYLLANPKKVVVSRPVFRTARAPPPPRMEPEFRQPPIRSWKPGVFHQMGVLTGEQGETLPLYGKEVRGRRDRYHFYTTTGGDNLYSIPVGHKDRDCMDDVGCQELHSSESVDVTGKGSFNVNMYRVDNFI